MPSLRLVNQHDYAVEITLEPESFIVDLAQGEHFEIVIADKDRAIALHAYKDAKTGRMGLAIWPDQSDYGVMINGERVF